MVLATVGVLLTAALTAPVAKYVLDLGWIEALLMGAVVASTDAAAVFLLIHSRGLRLRPRVNATLEVESGSNDPFAVFFTIVLVQFLVGEGSWRHFATELAQNRSSVRSSACSAAARSCWRSTGSACRRACMRRS